MRCLWRLIDPSTTSYGCIFGSCSWLGHPECPVARTVLYKERLYQRVRGYSHADAEVAPDPTSGWASPRSDAPLQPLSSEHLSALSDVDSMDGDSPVRENQAVIVSFVPSYQVLMSPLTPAHAPASIKLELRPSCRP